MRRTRALVFLGLSAAGLWMAVAGAEAAKRPQPVGIGSPSARPRAESRGATREEHRAGLVRADYSGVWKYLLPAYQGADSQSHWDRCRRSNPAAPPSVRITKVAVGSAQEIPIDLSLVGRRNVQEIELLVQYKSSGAAQAQYAVVYTFWLQQGKIWQAVWPGEEYQAYKAGSCYVALRYRRFIDRLVRTAFAEGRPC